MIVKNIKSFIEFYRFLGITDCISPKPRNKKNFFEESLSNNNRVKEISILKKKNVNNSEKLEKLNTLKLEIENLDCNLKETATNVVFSDGDYNSKIMIIGEAPGANEDIEGVPFVGEAGQLLDKMLGFIDLTRKNVYISNIVFWRPPGNRTPNEKELSICLPITKKHIDIIKPKLLILVGSVATKSLLNKSEGITKLRGQKHVYKTNNQNISARAIFHPAYLMRNPIEKKRTWDDLIEIDTLLKNEDFL